MRSIVTVSIIAFVVLCTGLPAAGMPERVPAWLLEVPSSVPEILVADARTATLRRFENNGHGIVQKDTRYMSIGRNGVGKERAWDRRTPLGVYFITEELDTRRLHEKYGEKAFVLDYPNAWDRHVGRTGDGIWLHGVDRREPDRPPRDTDGCLALPNEEIRRLAGDLQPLVTPLIVARDLEWATPAELAGDRDALRAALTRWERSIEAGDLPGYLDLYADDFRHRDMNRDEWAAWRRAVFARRGAAGVAIQDLLLVADPGERGLYLSRFTQVLEQDGRQLMTQKRLYWRRGADGLLAIVAEDNG